MAINLPQFQQELYVSLTNISSRVMWITLFLKKVPHQNYWLSVQIEAYYIYINPY